MHLVRRTLGSAGSRRFKILVTHHPFLPPPEHATLPIVGRAREAMRVIDACRVGLILSGHHHHSHAAETTPRYPVAGSSALVVQAGTATSLRTRAERNAFNVLTIERGPGERVDVRVDVRRWNGTRFEQPASACYGWIDGRWVHRPGAG